MNRSYFFIVAAALALFLHSASSRGGDDPAARPPNTGGSAGGSDDSTKQDANDLSSIGLIFGDEDAPSWLLTPITAVVTASAEVRSLIAVANVERADFTKKQDEANATHDGADKEARDQVREKAQVQREAFIVQQREIRDDLRKRVATLKEVLKDHHQAIDDAKEASQTRAHRRKDD